MYRPNWWLTWKWQNDCPSRNLSSLPYEFNTSQTLCVGDLIRNRSYFRQSKQAIRMVCRLCILYIFSKLFFSKINFYFDILTIIVEGLLQNDITVIHYVSISQGKEWKTFLVVIFNTVVVVLLKWRINIAIAYVLEMIYNNCGYR